MSQCSDILSCKGDSETSNENNVKQNIHQKVEESLVHLKRISASENKSKVDLDESSLDLTTQLLSQLLEVISSNSAESNRVESNSANDKQEVSLKLGKEPNRLPECGEEDRNNKRNTNSGCAQVKVERTDYEHAVNQKCTTENGTEHAQSMKNVSEDFRLKECLKNIISAFHELDELKGEKTVAEKTTLIQNLLDETSNMQVLLQLKLQKLKAEKQYRLVTFSSDEDSNHTEAVTSASETGDHLTRHTVGGNGSPEVSRSPPLNRIVIDEDHDDRMEKVEINIPNTVDREVDPLTRASASYSEESHCVHRESDTGNKTTDYHQAGPAPSEEWSGIENAQKSIIGPDEQSKVDDQKDGRKRKIRCGKFNQKNRKLKRQRGEEYVSATGKVVPKKECSTSPCNCKMQCNELIDQNRRNELFKHFYRIDWQMKNAFIADQIEVIEVENHKTKALISRRNNTRIYRLRDEQGIAQVVCKQFFKDTFALSDGSLTLILNRKSEEGTFCVDRRGRHTPHNKTGEDTINEVCTYLLTILHEQSTLSGPSVSHNLNKAAMYRRYKQLCRQNKRKSVTMYMFRHVLKTKFNI